MQHTPKKLPSKGHVMFFNPQGEHSPFEISRTLRAPRVTDINDNHPVMRWLTLSDTNFVKASVFRLKERQTPLVTSVRSPIAAAARDGRRKIVAMGFGLDGTDLMMRAAFPLLLVNYARLVFRRRRQPDHHVHHWTTRPRAPGRHLFYQAG